MTKNPLALAAGVLIMLLGIGMALFFTYHVFIEEHLFKSRAELSRGTIVRKETEHVRQAVFTDLAATRPTTGTPAVPATPAGASTTSTASTSSAAATTSTTADILQTKYRLHYAFLAAGSTVPVTGVYEATERQYNAMETAASVDVLYVPGRAAEEHRVQVPVEFGSSFWAGISVLLFGCLFIAYLGWCFIYPEEEDDEPVSAAERKREKRKKGGK